MQALLPVTLLVNLITNNIRKWTLNFHKFLSIQLSHHASMDFIKEQCVHRISPPFAFVQTTKCKRREWARKAARKCSDQCELNPIRYVQSVFHHVQVWPVDGRFVNRIHHEIRKPLNSNTCQIDDRQRLCDIGDCITITGICTNTHYQLNVGTRRRATTRTAAIVGYSSSSLQYRYQFLSHLYHIVQRPHSKRGCVFHTVTIPSYIPVQPRQRPLIHSLHFLRSCSNRIYSP